MIKIDKLTKAYTSKQGDVLALDNVSLHIKKGQVFGVIGKSGAGKSSLIRCINLLEKPTSGTIKIGDLEITQLSAKALRVERRKIGMIFQHFNLLSSKTVFENIALPLKLSDIPKKAIQQKVTELLALTNLEDKRDAYPAELSGGQKQRVAIARALANEPEVLLCDEATSALDPHTTSSILKLLRDINKQLNLTILLITHEMAVVKDICDAVAVLDQGRIIEQGNVLDIFTHPEEDMTRELINTALRLDLPESIREILVKDRLPEHHPLIRFTFIGKETAKPFMSNLSETLKIQFNILQANIELIHQQPVGLMLVQVLADDEQLIATLKYAYEHGLQTEVLGYVP
jgi:D-methionine transport system ATP-binding protein